MRIFDGLGNPVGGKFDGRKARRAVLTLEEARGPVSIMGPVGLFYADAVGAFGVVSAGRNWDLPASAVRRWALALVENGEIYFFYPCVAL